MLSIMFFDYLLIMVCYIQEVTALEFDDAQGYLMAVGSSAGKVNSKCDLCLTFGNT